MGLSRKVRLVLLDFLGTANAILSGRRMWFNAEIEMFVFVAAVYWVFTYAMTSVSRAIERSMSKGVGSGARGEERQQGAQQHHRGARAAQVVRRHFHVLRGISMEIYEGEKMVIFGPSGSGKSTFIRTLNRLEVHQRGDIIVDGIELSADIRNIDAIRSEIGMVFQSFNLFPHLTVIDNITLAPILVRHMSKEDANELAMQYLERSASRSRR